MKKPKTTKAFLKILLAVADSVSGDFSDCDKLTEEENQLINSTIAGLQNDLGDVLQPVLEKYKLQWKG